MVTRRESVLIEATSNLSTVALKDAAAVSLLRKEVGDLDGTDVKTAKSTETVTQGVNRQGDAFRKQTASIDQFSGRLRLLSEAALFGGPALVAMGAVAIPAITGIASALGFAAIGAGTMIAGFQGVGTALEAVSKAQLEPTAANLKAAREAMEALSPAAQNIVRDIDRLGPALTELRDASAAGMAPELSRGVDSLIEGLPRLRGLFEETSRAAAGVLADGAGALTSERWQPFLNFLEREAPQAIESLGRSGGDLAHAFAEVWRATGDLNGDVLSAIERGASNFDEWATGLRKTKDFESFLSYVRETGPLVGDALASMSSAVLNIAEAAAPLGGPVLRAISGISDAVATIANSPLGTPFLAAVTGVLALNRALKITAALSAAPAVGALLGTGTAAAGAGAAAASASRLTALKTAAPKAGLAGVGITAAVTGSDILDTFSRSFGTSTDDAVGSLAKLEDALNRSNVGKFSEDLGIDVGRLSEDVAKFGTSGEYYQEVVAKFDEGGWGKAAKGALDFINPMIGSTEKATAAQNDLSRVLDTNAALLGSQNPLGGAVDGALSGVVGALEDANDAGQAFRRTLQSVTAALEGRASMRDFEASIDDASAALRQNGKTLDINTAKGRANAAALDNIAISSLAVADGMRGANRIEFLKGARGQFIDMARDMGKTAEQARRLADSLGLIDRTKTAPKIDLVDGPFKAALRAINNGLNAADGREARPTASLNDGPFQGRRAALMAALNVADRFTASPTVGLNDHASGPARSIKGLIAGINDKWVTVTIQTKRVGASAGAGFGVNLADGGLVRGPGGPRDDAIPAMLSNGEYVVNAASTARNRPLLEQLNAQKLADGGMVRPQPWREQVAP